VPLVFLKGVKNENANHVSWGCTEYTIRLRVVLGCIPGGIELIGYGLGALRNMTISVRKVKFPCVTHRYRSFFKGGTLGMYTGWNRVDRIWFRCFSEHDDFRT